MTLNRWLNLFPQADPKAATQAYERLRAHYAESQRAYHTLEHIRSCLELLDSVESELEDARTLELALWYHDVIYNPRAGDNEEQSAQMAIEELAELGEPEACQQEVARMIRVTQHPSEPRTEDDCYLLDIDLSMLGADPEAFDEYERQIRFEYQWVPWVAYRNKRAEVLRLFLEQQAIYRTRPFRETREEQARRNIRNALASQYRLD